jgi:hypothetical protein
MIAVKMNDEALPVEHGYPARLIVPGLYGYVSATKWLKELELTTLEAFDAYWVPRGWAKEAPILTQSRIDVPRDGSGVNAGRRPSPASPGHPTGASPRWRCPWTAATWQACTLSQAISKATWVQWELPWTAPAGRHLIEVRATDGTGEVQTDQLSDPAPYFSTPVMTMPRTKTRWKMMNTTTGMIRVSIVPAWIRPGSWATRAPLNRARPTASVWRSGLELR